MAWQDWRKEETAQLWKGALDVVRRECAEFNSRFLLSDLEMTGPRWDSPDLELHWKAGGAERNIHIQLSGDAWPLEVSFSGAAWIDDPKPGERLVSWWKGPGPQRVADTGELKSAVTTLLPNARIEVEKLAPALRAREAGNFGD